MHDFFLKYLFISDIKTSAKRVASVEKIEELAGTPPDWSNGAEHIVGKPQSPLGRCKNKQFRGGCSGGPGRKFWLGGGDESTDDDKSASVVFLNGGKSAGNGGDRAVPQVVFLEPYRCIKQLVI